MAATPHRQTLRGHSIFALAALRGVPILSPLQNIKSSLGLGNFSRM